MRCNSYCTRTVQIGRWFCCCFSHNNNNNNNNSNNNNNKTYQTCGIRRLLKSSHVIQEHGQLQFKWYINTSTAEHRIFNLVIYSMLSWSVYPCWRWLSPCSLFTPSIAEARIPWWFCRVHRVRFCKQSESIDWYRSICRVRFFVWARCSTADWSNDARSAWALLDHTQCEVDRPHTERVLFVYVQCVSSCVVTVTNRCDSRAAIGLVVDCGAPRSWKSLLTRPVTELETWTPVDKRTSCAGLKRTGRNRRIGPPIE